MFFNEIKKNKEQIIKEFYDDNYSDTIKNFSKEEKRNFLLNAVHSDNIANMEALCELGLNSKEFDFDTIYEMLYLSAQKKDFAKRFELLNSTGFIEKSILDDKNCLLSQLFTIRSDKSVWELTEKYNYPKTFKASLSYMSYLITKLDIDRINELLNKGFYLQKDDITLKSTLESFKYLDINNKKQSKAALELITKLLPPEVFKNIENSSEEKNLIISNWFSENTPLSDIRKFEKFYGEADYNEKFFKRVKNKINRRSEKDNYLYKLLFKNKYEKFDFLIKKGCSLQFEKETLIKQALKEDAPLSVYTKIDSIPGEYDLNSIIQNNNLFFHTIVNNKKNSIKYLYNNFENYHSELLEMEGVFKYVVCLENFDSVSTYPTYNKERNAEILKKNESTVINYLLNKDNYKTVAQRDSNKYIESDGILSLAMEAKNEAIIKKIYEDFDLIEALNETLAVKILNFDKFPNSRNEVIEEVKSTLSFVGESRPLLIEYLTNVKPTTDDNHFIQLKSVEERQILSNNLKQNNDIKISKQRL